MTICTSLPHCFCYINTDGASNLLLKTLTIPICGGLCALDRRCIMKYVTPIFRAIGFCAIVALPGTALAAAEPVGSAIVIKQNVFGFSADGARDLRVSDAVYRNEEISAASGSHGELELSDGSKIIVGENSVVLLDDFVVGDGGFRSGSIKVVKGAFRFITGSSKKGAFTVTTPMATIGVRGTFFDVYVGGGKETVVLFRGEVKVCTSSGCQIARRSCDVIEINEAGVVEKAPFLGSWKANKAERDYNLVDNQNRFSKSLRAPKILCNARAAMEALDPASNEGRDWGGDFGIDSTTTASVGNSSTAPATSSNQAPSSPTGVKSN